MHRSRNSMWVFYKHKLVTALVAVVFCLFSIEVTAQLRLDSPQLPVCTSPSVPSLALTSPPNTQPIRKDVWRLPQNRRSPYVPRVLPAHFGAFCKIELKLEAKSRIAPRFRLGSADYVDRLEGKHH